MSGRHLRGRSRKSEEKEVTDVYELSTSSESEADSRPRPGRKKVITKRKNETNTEKMDRMLTDSGLTADEIGGMSTQEKMRYLAALEDSKNEQHKIEHVQQLFNKQTELIRQQNIKQKVKQPMRSTRSPKVTESQTLLKYMYESSEDESSEVRKTKVVEEPAGDGGSVQRRRSPRKIAEKLGVVQDTNMKDNKISEDKIPVSARKLLQGNRGEMEETSLHVDNKAGIELTDDERPASDVPQPRGKRGRPRSKRAQQDDRNNNPGTKATERMEMGKTTRRGIRAGKKVQPAHSEDHNITEFFTNDKQKAKRDTQQQADNDPNLDDCQEEPAASVFPNTQDIDRFHSSSMMSTPGEPPQIIQVDADIHSTPKSISKTLTNSASKILGSIKSYFSGNNDSSTRSQSVKKKSADLMKNVKGGNDTDRDDESDASVVFDGASQASLSRTASQNNQKKIQLRSTQRLPHDQHLSRDSSPELFASQDTDNCPREQGNSSNEDVAMAMDGVESTNEDVAMVMDGVESTNEDVAMVMDGVESTNEDVSMVMDGVESANEDSGDETQPLGLLQLSVSGNMSRLEADETVEHDTGTGNSQPEPLLETKPPVATKRKIQENEDYPSAKRPVMFDFELGFLPGRVCEPAGASSPELANKWWQKTKVKGIQLFAPEDADPISYSKIIIEYFEQYRVLLREMQNVQPVHLKWGRPVVVGPHCKRSLDLRDADDACDDDVISCMSTRGRLGRRNQILDQAQTYSKGEGQMGHQSQATVHNQSKPTHQAKLIPAQPMPTDHFFGTKKLRPGRVVKPQPENIVAPIMNRTDCRQSTPFVPDTQPDSSDSSSDDDFVCFPRFKKKKLSCSANTSATFVPETQDFDDRDEENQPINISCILESPDVKTGSVTKKSNPGNSASINMKQPVIPETSIKDDVKGQTEMVSAVRGLRSKKKGGNSQESVRKEILNTTFGETSGSNYEDLFADKEKKVPGKRLGKDSKKQKIVLEPELFESLPKASEKEVNTIKTPASSRKSRVVRKTPQRKGQQLDSDTDEDITVIEVQQAGNVQQKGGGVRNKQNPKTKVNARKKEPELEPENPILDDEIQPNVRTRASQKIQTSTNHGEGMSSVCQARGVPGPGPSGNDKHPVLRTGNKRKRIIQPFPDLSSSNSEDESEQKKSKQVKEQINEDDMQCPMCFRHFTAAIIEAHAADCKGKESDTRGNQGDGHHGNMAASDQGPQQYGSKLVVVLPGLRDEEPQVFTDDSLLPKRPVKQYGRQTRTRQTAKKSDLPVERDANAEDERKPGRTDIRLAKIDDDKDPEMGDIGSDNEQPAGSSSPLHTGQLPKPTNRRPPRVGEGQRTNEGQGRVLQLHQEVQLDCIMSPVVDGPTESCPMCGKRVPTAEFQNHVPTCVDNAELSSVLNDIDAKEPEVPVMRTTRRLARPPLRSTVTQIGADLIEDFDENQPLDPGRRRHYLLQKQLGMVPIIQNLNEQPITAQIQSHSTGCITSQSSNVADQSNKIDSKSTNEAELKFSEAREQSLLQEGGPSGSSSPVNGRLSPFKMFRPISMQSEGLIDFKNQFRRSSITEGKTKRGVGRKRKAQSTRGKARKQSTKR